MRAGVPSKLIPQPHLSRYSTPSLASPSVASLHGSGSIPSIAGDALGIGLFNQLREAGAFGSSGTDAPGASAVVGCPLSLGLGAGSGDAKGSGWAMRTQLGSGVGGANANAMGYSRQRRGSLIGDIEELAEMGALRGSLAPALSTSPTCFFLCVSPRRCFWCTHFTICLSIRLSPVAPR